MPLQDVVVLPAERFTQEEVEKIVAAAQSGRYRPNDDGTVIVPMQRDHAGQLVFGMIVTLPAGSGVDGTVENVPVEVFFPEDDD